MLTPAQTLRRIRLTLWLVILILALTIVGTTLGSLLGYGFGIAAALVVAAAHFFLGRYIKARRKSPWLLALPATLAVLGPFLYFAFKIYMNGSFTMALIKGLLPSLILGVLPLVLLLWSVQKIKQLESQLG